MSSSPTDYSALIFWAQLGVINFTDWSAEVIVLVVYRVV